MGLDDSHDTLQFGTGSTVGSNLRLGIPRYNYHDVATNLLKFGDGQRSVVNGDYTTHADQCNAATSIAWVTDIDIQTTLSMLLFITFKRNGSARVANYLMVANEDGDEGSDESTTIWSVTNNVGITNLVLSAGANDKLTITYDAANNLDNVSVTAIGGY